MIIVQGVMGFMLCPYIIIVSTPNDQYTLSRLTNLIGIRSSVCTKAPHWDPSPTLVSLLEKKESRA